MEIFLILTKQLVVMFLFILIGAILYKSGRITEKGSESLGNLLINLSLPCVILNSFLVERTAEKVQFLLFSIVFSLVILILALVIARLFFKKNPISNFAAAFSNPGFFGIPLISAVLGSKAVFYVAPFIACLNILQGTYGVSTLKEEKVNINAKKLLTSPFMISFAIGLLLFFLQIPLPGTLKTVISSSAGLNTPIAMIVSGTYLAKVNLKAMVHTKELYWISAVRLILIPILSCLLLSVLPSGFYELKMCLFIVAACPVGSNVAVYAQLHKKNYSYAAQTVVISTLLSAITIPVFAMIIQGIWTM